MTPEEQLYIETGSNLPSAENSKMFGKPCFKINGKAFICFFENCIVCKLSGSDHDNAISLKGTRLFDPSGKGRAMKEWVQIPFANNKQWLLFATAAYNYVKG